MLGASVQDHRCSNDVSENPKEVSSHITQPADKEKCSMFHLVSIIRDANAPRVEEIHPPRDSFDMCSLQLGRHEPNPISPLSLDLTP